MDREGNTNANSNADRRKQQHIQKTAEVRRKDSVGDDVFRLVADPRLGSPLVMGLVIALDEMFCSAPAVARRGPCCEGHGRCSSHAAAILPKDNHMYSTDLSRLYGVPVVHTTEIPEAHSVRPQPQL